MIRKKIVFYKYHEEEQREDDKMLIKAIIKVITKMMLLKKQTLQAKKLPQLRKNSAYSMIYTLILKNLDFHMKLF